MVCALLIVSGLALFLAGIIVGAILVFLLEKDPTPDVDAGPPPVLDDPSEFRFR